MFILRNKMRVVSTALILSTVLSACGGGGGSNTSTPPTPSAQADVAAATLNTSSTIAVLANDSITSGGTLKLVSVTAPAHGSATINGDKIVYTPTAGFFGKDSFSYTAKDIGSGTATASGDVAVTVSANLTLSGNTFDLPGNAVLAVTVGATTINASTDASGNFSVPVALDTPASMISITAQGRDTKSYIKLISLVGDSQAAVNAAGAGTVVTPASLPNLSVSSMSTAVYGNALFRNGGQVPATQAKLDEASGQISGSEMLQMAAVLHSFIGNAGTGALLRLPAGMSDTLALVSNYGKYAQFIKTISEGTITSEMPAIEDNANIGTVPAVSVTTSKSLNFFNNGGCCAAGAIELVLNPDSSGSFYRDQKRLAGTWHKDSALTLVLTAPLVYPDTVPMPNSGSAEVEVSINSVSMRQLSGTASQGFAILTYVGSIHYINGELPDAPYSTGQLYPFSDWDSLSLPSDLSGAVLAGIPDVARPPVIYVPQVITTLAAGGSVSSPQMPAADIVWQVKNGKLVLDFRTPYPVTLTLARVRINANGEERWLARAANGVAYTVYETMIVRPQTGLAFTDTNVLQRWNSSPITTYIASQAIVKVLAGSTSGTETAHLDGSITNLIPTTWAIENGTLAMRSPNSERIWTLLHDDGNSIVVLEKYTSLSGTRQRIARYGRN